MAHAICDLAEGIGRENSTKFILPVVQSILKDSSTEVRVSLMENLGKLVKVIG